MILQEIEGEIGFMKGVERGTETNKDIEWDRVIEIMTIIRHIVNAMSVWGISKEIEEEGVWKEVVTREIVDTGITD